MKSMRCICILLWLHTHHIHTAVYYINTALQHLHFVICIYELCESVVENCTCDGRVRAMHACK